MAYGIGQKRYNIDIKKVKAAALLHDIGRIEKYYEEIGKEILKNLCYDEIAAIVSVYTDIEINDDQNVMEAEIVYLADKLVIEDRSVSLDERFIGPMKKYSENPEVIGKIVRRLENARKIMVKINKITGEDY